MKTNITFALSVNDNDLNKHMKTISGIAFVLCLVISSLSFGQNTIIKMSGMPYDTISKLITYKEVVQMKSTRDELYVRAIEWIGATYKNAERVTSKRDRENGVIEGIARFKINYTDKDGQKSDAGNISYKILLECKDGRFRFTFNGFNLDSQSRFPIEKWLNKKDVAYNPSWDQYLKDVDAFMKTLIAGLKKAMQPPVKIDDSW